MYLFVCFNLYFSYFHLFICNMLMLCCSCRCLLSTLQLLSLYFTYHLTTGLHGVQKKNTKLAFQHIVNSTNHVQISFTQGPIYEKILRCRFTEKS